VVVTLLVVVEKIFEEPLRLILKNGTIIWSNSDGKLKSMNSISLSSNDCLGMTERVVLVAKFNSLFSGLLEPMHFFLEEDVIVLILKLFYQKFMMKAIYSIKVFLNALQSSFNMLFPFKNVTKDLMVENDWMLPNFV